MECQCLQNSLSGSCVVQNCPLDFSDAFWTQRMTKCEPCYWDIVGQYEKGILLNGYTKRHCCGYSISWEGEAGGRLVLLPPSTEESVEVEEIDTSSPVVARVNVYRNGASVCHKDDCYHTRVWVLIDHLYTLPRPFTGIS